MNSMKTEELMRFDWVCLVDDPTPRQIDWIRSGEVGLFWGKTVTPPYLEPIPLTTEILEKNGFEVQDQGGGRKDVWTGFGVDCEGDIEVNFQYNVPVHLKIDGGFKGEYYTSANIKYVHQLQHAFILCGIEKEFKI